MSNTFFQFKQFKIEQDRCAMKVTTDACIQGAWSPVLPQVQRVLDIGAGTGLLSLMLAQRNDALLIYAIELDADAALQAQGNIESSPWQARINVINGDACNYPFIHKYDLIICNPPFFNNSLLSNTGQKTMARHTLSLTQTDLLKALDNNLTTDGYASILLPFAEYQLWTRLLQQHGWTEVAKLEVSHSPGAAVKRVVSLCSKKTIAAMAPQSLVIKDDKGAYTTDFIALLSPFYLQL